MKKIDACLLLFLISHCIAAQPLYTRAFGNNKNPALIFLHGGPGYNAASFEETTAQKLADNGCYVIVYDRRGEGRSPDAKARYTFQETFDDLNSVYQKYELQSAALIGHSFGGVVATLYAGRFPQRVQSVILVSAPVSLQETYRTILSRTRSIYAARKDSVNLGYLSMLAGMDTAALEYSTYCFAHAMQNGFYQPKKPDEEAKRIYADMRADSTMMKYAGNMSYEAPKGFWEHEKYTCINLTQNLAHLQAQKVKVYGLYGRDDGLYSEEQVVTLQKLLGNDKVQYLDNCSHSVFIDRQAAFIAAVKSWVR